MNRKFYKALATTALLTLLLGVLAGCVVPATAPQAAQPAPASADTSAAPARELTKVDFGLVWVVQGEFAGYLVAKDKGFYEEEGLDVTVIPGGPDAFPPKLLASGALEIGGGPPQSVITGRAQGIRLVSVMTQNQIDGLRLVCKKKTGINEWKDLEGRKVGVWFGGGEFPLYYAVEKAGIDKDSVQWLPQKFSMVEFFEDKFDCASVQVWNELHIVYDAGYSPDDITVLNAADLGIYLPADGVLVTEKMLNEKPEIVQAFVNASLRGWKYTLEHPEEAAEITLKFAPDLDYRKQLIQVEEVNKLLISGGAEEKGMIGYQRLSDWEISQDMLLFTDQVDEPMDLEQGFTNKFWEAAPAEYKTIGDREALLKRIEENLQ
jgi:NitT/TauT family transport system substrate-binding protein